VYLCWRTRVTGCYEAEPLLLMSGLVTDHSQKLPADLLQSIIASKRANAGIFNMRQCILALFDQRIHSVPQADTARVWEEVSAEHSPIKPTPNTNFAAGFGHLAGGYDAQYYGYMWSQVYSADMFESRFKVEGVLNAATGRAYRKEVVSRGGSIDATEMLRNFLGREPNDAAFLRSKGLAM
jgi:thimet oligopeptidase